jgi:hypothetical protein
MSWTRPAADLRAQVQKLWERGDLLASVVTGEPLFPRRLTLRGPSSQEMTDRFDAVRAWIGELRRMPHCRVEMREFRHRLFGANAVPAASAWIDSLDDALALIGKRRDASRFGALLELTRACQPPLLAWLAKRPLRALELADEWPACSTSSPGCRRHPRPGVYLRQVDIPGVHSKFIEAQRGVLGELLDLALPPAAIDPSAAGVSQFARRYGFRDKPQRIRFRILDRRHALLAGDPEQDLTLDARSFARIDPQVERVFITENEINFLAFPGGAAQPDPLRRRLRLRDAARGRMAVALPHPLLGRHRHPRLRHPRPVARPFRRRRIVPDGSCDAAGFRHALGRGGPADAARSATTERGGGCPVRRPARQPPAQESASRTGADRFWLGRGPACRTECRARRLKLADICRAAGIARTTLDRYYHDQVKSIDREVLGRLCQYLRVKPGVADFAVKPRTNRATNQQNRRPASADYFFQTI